LELIVVAIDYGTTRLFSEEPQYHLIYDMGAGSTTATIVSFSSRSVTEGKSNKTVIDISTHGIGYDRELGGDLFNARMVDTLIEAFRTSKSGSKSKTDIRADGRAIARLFREVSKVKHVLSANMDTTAMVTSLLGFADIRLNRCMKV
jgi:hypoxia up-regulated 1